MNNLKKAFGFSLVELLVSMGLASVLALGIMSLNGVMNKSSVTSNAEYQADLFRKQIANLLQNRVAWKNTLSAAGNSGTFSCITGNTDCTAASSNGPPAGSSYQYYKFSIANGSCSPVTSCNGGFNVYDTSNVIYYNVASDSTLGFDSTGAQCHSNWAHGATATGFPGWTGTNYSGNVAYSTNTQASMCPFRLVLYWLPICPETTGTNCIAPMIHVMGYTLYTPYNSDKTHNINFNPFNYGINLILPPTYQ